MNISQRAFEAVQLSIQSRRELPLSVIGTEIAYHATSESTFVDNGEVVVCRQRKFSDLPQIQTVLSDLLERGWLYLHKLHEQDVYGPDLQATGNTDFYLSYSVKRIVNINE
jgi:hypothetical protein